jgi:hypothetical protein
MKLKKRFEGFSEMIELIEVNAVLGVVIEGRQVLLNVDVDWLVT